MPSGDMFILADYFNSSDLKNEAEYCPSYLNLHGFPLLKFSSTRYSHDLLPV